MPRAWRAKWVRLDWLFLEPVTSRIQLAVALMWRPRKRRQAAALQKGHNQSQCGFHPISYTWGIAWVLVAREVQLEYLGKTWHGVGTRPTAGRRCFRGHVGAERWARAARAISRRDAGGDAL